MKTPNNMKQNWVQKLLKKGKKNKEDQEKLELLKKLSKDVGKVVDTLYNDRSKIRMTETEIDEYGTKTIHLAGGLNGCGEWGSYLKDLSRIVKRVNMKHHMWLIKLDNDCLDDLFYGVFGIDVKTEESDE